MQNFVQVPEQCPTSIAALIKECMRPTSSERPTAKEIFDRMQVRPPQEPRSSNSDCPS